MLSFQRGYPILDVRLKEAEATIYNNATAQAIRGDIKNSYMAPYNATVGFVKLNKEETR